MAKKEGEKDGKCCETGSAPSLHLYRRSRNDFEHTLGTFPLVFPDDANGQTKKTALLQINDRFGWQGIE